MTARKDASARGRASRRKGKTGEREVASVLREYGYDARRGVQYCGRTGAPDVIGLPGIHIECKRVERLNLQDAYDQSKRDARESETPVVIHRRSHCPWLVTMSLDDWIGLYTSWALDHDITDNNENNETEE